MRRRLLVAIAGGVAGLLIGLLASRVTGWRWWVRICVAIAPPIALLVAERKRFIRTTEEISRPISIFPHEHGDSDPKTSTRDTRDIPLH
ncbi:MAG TPA: hypothetical protein VES20_21660 [Bryobacteraceae bacterium]|nr:hypothetical protein [Bryobacteraceae bacterium]